jgi:hypothetical protein
VSDVKRIAFQDGGFVTDDPDGDYVLYTDFATERAAREASDERARMLLDAKNHWADRAIKALAERDALAARVEGLEGVLAEAPVWLLSTEIVGDLGACVSVDGMDTDHPLNGTRVRLVRDAAIAHAPGAGNREDGK